MQQDQREAEKKRNEAAQHPWSQVKRIIFSRGKSDRVESKRKGQSNCTDDNSPAQQAFARFARSSGQSFFCEGDGFLVAHVTQECKETKDDCEDTDDAKAGENIVHGGPFQNNRAWILFHALLFYLMAMILILPLLVWTVSCPPPPLM